MDFKAAIFDVDGTLVDSMGIWVEIDKQFFKNHNREMPEDFPNKVSEIGLWQTALYTADYLSDGSTPEGLMSEWHEMSRREYEDNIILKEGVKEYLDTLKAKGIKMAIASALVKTLYEPLLKRNGIYDYFDAYVSSGELKLSKGDPDIYLYAAKKLGVEPKDCVVFEDIVEGINGAKLAGMKTVAVYEETTPESQNELKRISDKYIISFTEMLDMV